MGRKSLWKDIPIQSRDDMRHLQSYAQSCVGAWSGYVVDTTSCRGHIETNLPYTELRRWFRNAIGAAIPEHMTNTRPSWELCDDSPPLEQGAGDFV